MSDKQTRTDQLALDEAHAFRVYDRNQRGDRPRRHEIIVRTYDDGREPDTVTYELWSDQSKPCLMPMEHAFKFLTDPAYVVLNPKGVRVMPVEKIDVSKPISELADDEIVVKYEELSREALLRRVKVLPGSEDVRENARSEDLVAFLINWRKKLKGMSAGERALAEKVAMSDTLGGVMSAEQLESMFPTRKAA